MLTLNNINKNSNNEAKSKLNLPTSLLLYWLNNLKGTEMPCLLNDCLLYLINRDF